MAYNEYSVLPPSKQCSDYIVMPIRYQYKAHGFKSEQLVDQPFIMLIDLSSACTVDEVIIPKANTIKVATKWCINDGVGPIVLEDPSELMSKQDRNECPFYNHRRCSHDKIFGPNFNCINGCTMPDFHFRCDEWGYQCSGDDRSIQKSICNGRVCYINDRHRQDSPIPCKKCRLHTSKTCIFCCRIFNGTDFLISYGMHGIHVADKHRRFTYPQFYIKMFYKCPAGHTSYNSTTNEISQCICGHTLFPALEWNNCTCKLGVTQECKYSLKNGNYIKEINL